MVGRAAEYGLVASRMGPLVDVWRYSWDTDNDLVVGANVAPWEKKILTPQKSGANIVDG